MSDTPNRSSQMVDEFASFVSASFNDVDSGIFCSTPSTSPTNSLAVAEDTFSPFPLPKISIPEAEHDSQTGSPPSFIRRVSSHATALLNKATRSKPSSNTTPTSPTSPVSVLSRAVNYLSIPSRRPGNVYGSARPAISRRPDSWRIRRRVSSDESFLQFPRSSSVPLLSSPPSPHRPISSSSSFFDFDHPNSYLEPRTPPLPPSPSSSPPVSPKSPSELKRVRVPSRSMTSKLNPFSRRKVTGPISYPIQTFLSPPSTPSTSAYSPGQGCFDTSFSTTSPITPPQTANSDRAFFTQTSGEPRSIYRGEISQRGRVLTLEEDPFRRDSVSIVHPSAIPELRHSRRVSDGPPSRWSPSSSPSDTGDCSETSYPRHQSCANTSTPLRSHRRSHQPGRRLNLQEFPRSSLYLEGQEQVIPDLGTLSPLAPSLEIYDSPSTSSSPCVDAPSFSIKSPDITSDRAPSPESVTSSPRSRISPSRSEPYSTLLGIRRERTPPRLTLSPAEDTYQLAVVDPSHSSATLVQTVTGDDLSLEQQLGELGEVSSNIPSAASASVTTLRSFPSTSPEPSSSIIHTSNRRPSLCRNISATSVNSAADTFYTAHTRPTSRLDSPFGSPQLVSSQSSDQHPRPSLPPIRIKNMEQIFIEGPSWREIKNLLCEGSMGDVVVWALDGDSDLLVDVVGIASGGLKMVVQTDSVQAFDLGIYHHEPDLASSAWLSRAIGPSVTCLRISIAPPDSPSPWGPSFTRLATDSDDDSSDLSGEDETLLAFSIPQPSTLRAIVEKAGEMRLGEGI